MRINWKKAANYIVFTSAVLAALYLWDKQVCSGNNPPYSAKPAEVIYEDFRADESGLKNIIGKY